jgi:16S rRNA (uracil1498-N3)-methyltransferase
MTRLFTEKTLPEDQQTYSFSGEEARYLSDVLRIQPGENICLCDGARTDFTGRVSTVTRENVTVDLIKREPNRTEPPYEAVMYQALVKGDKMDLIIQKGVELGVSKIVPVSCIRSIVKLEGKDTPKKIARWQKIAEEAARQCGRGTVPIVESPLSFTQAVRAAKEQSDLAFLPWECEKSRPLSQLLNDYISELTAEKPLSAEKLPIQKSIPRLVFFIGPEGGFDPKEIDEAQAAGIKTVTLGRRILRTETAGIAVLSMFIYRLELM